MGYTRYWQRTEKPYDEEFINQVQQIVAKCNSYGISLCDGFGEGNPEISMDKIWINGNASIDTDYETFAILNTSAEQFEARHDLCKTARRPYDYAVREILKIAEEQGIVKGVSSDGDNNEIISDLDFLLDKFTTYSATKLIMSSNETKRNLYQQLKDLIDSKMSVDEKFKKCKEICSQDEEMNNIFNDFIQKHNIEV